MNHPVIQNKQKLNSQDRDSHEFIKNLIFLQNRPTTYSGIHQRKSVQQQQQQNDNNYITISGKHNFSVQKELVPPNKYSSAHKRPQTTPFENNDQLKDTLKQIHNLRCNSPTYQTNNPITSEGHQENIFRSSVKKTMYSDIDNIRNPPVDLRIRPYTNAEYGHLMGPSEQKEWKPACRKVDVKKSGHYEVFEKRGLKQTMYYSGTTSSDNPILGQDEKVLRQRQTAGAGDQIISEQYQRINRRRDFEPSDREQSDKWERYTSSNIFFCSVPQEQQNLKCTVPNKYRGDEAKNLLGYEYALPYNRQKELTEKINKNKHNRYVSYNQANDYDFRKRSDRLQKEENYAQKNQRNFDSETASSVYKIDYKNGR